MTTEQHLATIEDRQVALHELETRFAMATRQRALLEQYIRERLKPDKHYYSFGDGTQKPSLTKEGAELIALPHALKAHYEWISGPSNPPQDDAPYQVTMKCTFEASGGFAGEGVGSASSMVTKKTGERVQRQNDPGLRHNATIKMACKSAYIAATLNATAASEFFTQDMEDDQSGSKAEPDKSQHWCKDHNTAFFKRGQMKHYAHPIEGTKEWCNEPTPKPQSAPQKPPQAQQRASAAPPGKTAGEQIASTELDDYPPELEDGGPLTEPAQTASEPQQTVSAKLTWGTVAARCMETSIRPEQVWAAANAHLGKQAVKSWNDMGPNKLSPDWAMQAIQDIKAGKV